MFKIGDFIKIKDSVTAEELSAFGIGYSAGEGLKTGIHRIIMIDEGNLKISWMGLPWWLYLDWCEKVGDKNV